MEVNLFFNEYFYSKSLTSHPDNFVKKQGYRHLSKKFQLQYVILKKRKHCCSSI